MPKMIITLEVIGANEESFQSSLNHALEMTRRALSTEEFENPVHKEAKQIRSAGLYFCRVKDDKVSVYQDEES